MEGVPPRVSEGGEPEGVLFPLGAGCTQESQRYEPEGNIPAAGVPVHQEDYGLAIPASRTDRASMQSLQALANKDKQHHVHYLERTWIRSSVWTPRYWSVYRQSIRTNNDVEGDKCIFIKFR